MYLGERREIEVQLLLERKQVVDGVTAVAAGNVDDKHQHLGVCDMAEEPVELRV